MTRIENGAATVPSIEAGVLNAVAHSCWQTSDDHGFHEDWDLASWLEERADEVANGTVLDTEDAVTFRVIAEALRTNILGMKLALVHSELSEALATLRLHGASGLLSTEPYDDPHTTSPANFGEELADAKIRIDDLAGCVKVAIGDTQMAKMKYNEGRPFKHGKKV